MTPEGKPQVPESVRSAIGPTTPALPTTSKADQDAAQAQGVRWLTCAGGG